ncbi:MAG TPA: hypothetical protein PLS46_04640 [Microthrixaceae bacterium]|nr:hypothetical protein [Microthrixaceae bacterium]
MSVPRRIAGKLRRTLAPPPDGAVAARLDHHYQALHDITTALQAVQATVGPHLEQQLHHQAAVLDQVEQTMPDLLNVISSAKGQQRGMARQIADIDAARRCQADAIADLARQVSELWDRLERARAELMFELRFQPSGNAPAAAPTAGAAATVAADIVNQSAVDERRATGSLRLNLGCGHQPLPDYLNVDMRALPDVDVVATVDDLPFEAGELDEIFSAHVVEHFPQAQLERSLLPYWFGMLRPGGTFRAVVPDAGAMLTGYAAGQISFDDLREVTFGGQEYEGDFHFNFYTTESLAELLTAAGFDDVTIEAEGRPNGKCLEFQVAARKPA